MALFLAINQIILAQSVNLAEFDPAKSPIAIELDSSTVVSAVSDYVLIKVLKASVPSVGRIKRVECIIGKSGAFLEYELAAKGKNGMPIFIEIPLIRNQQGGYFASSNGISCTGCAQCAPQAGSPCGCCSLIPPASGFGAIILKKVSTQLESFKNE